ncbi:glycosyl hydrolase [Mycena maculata]|uniref:Endo-1,5-alpha-L-arabinanase A n=1 Tax=Mycena maculata TaxID=230809 RepID=A0AAD7HLG4_9AGAR|nr:glycosyl hydrolase [Mycena maculata]
MASFKFYFAAILTLVPACTYAHSNPLPFTGDITSPLGCSPTLCKKGTITTYLTAGGVGIPIYTSTNLVAWKQVGVVFPDGAPWTAPYTGGDNGRLWAPDCKIADGVFRLFYAASTLGSWNPAIFCTRLSDFWVLGSWTNGGRALSSTMVDDFNAIYPNLSLDPVPYLSFGSYWSGIKGPAGTLSWNPDS